MKALITTILFFLIQLSVFAQPKITRETYKIWNEELQDWKNISENSYQYNAEKETTLFQQSVWYDDEQKFIGEKKITYDYSPLSTFISEFRSIYDNNTTYWKLRDTSEYIFNAAGCRIQFKENSDFINWRTDYEYLDDCLLKSSTLYYIDRLSTNSDWQIYERSSYSYSNNNKTKNFITERYAGGNEWTLLSKGHEKYDDRGNLIEKFNSNDPTELFENNYDSKDRLIHQKLYTPSGPDDVLMQRRETLYEYFEDENGFLVKMLLHRRYDSDSEFFTFTYLYENYCDGLVKKEEYNRLDGTQRQWVYEWDEPTNCLENDEIKMLISPNPSSGSLTIFSELLLQNTQISIYSSNGQLIQNIPVKERLETQQLNLGDFANGFYFIRLKSEGHSITEPFVILK